MSSFLNNSGDIILDAILTDEGRRRLARGDGSFRIAVFSLGDDEINYNLYDASQGTAYADLNIMKTPVLEAITDSSIGLKHKLLTIEKEDLLFLPILKLNTNNPNLAKDAGKPLANNANNTNTYVIMATDVVIDNYNGSNEALPDGFIDGTTASDAGSTNSLIVVDQGLDTNQISYTKKMTPDLEESQIIVEMDDRLLKLVLPGGDDAEPSFIDDVNIATYYLGGSSAAFGEYPTSDKKSGRNASSIAGPRGRRFRLGLRASVNAQISNHFYDTLGSQITGYYSVAIGSAASTTARTIDTIVRVAGGTIGYTLDIPVRLIKELNTP